MDLEDSGDRGTKIVGFGLRSIMDVNRKATSRDVEDGSSIKVFLRRVRMSSNIQQCFGGLTEKACAFSVAELIMTLISERNLAMSLMRGIRMSVFTLRSWASSMTMVL